MRYILAVLLLTSCAPHTWDKPADMTMTEARQRMYECNRDGQFQSPRTGARQRIITECLTAAGFTPH